MTHDEIINAWNEQADYMNKWDRLGEDEKLDWAMKLEREACAKVVDEFVGCESVAYKIRARGNK
jgi:hypothetical protein